MGAIPLLRLKILERDEFFCQNCGDSEETLDIHHKLYLPGKKPWEYHDSFYITLCRSCHKIEKDLIEEREVSV